MKRVLHAGSGRRSKSPVHWSFKGWEEVRVDINPGMEPDIVDDVRSLKSIAFESFDGVYASHLLEHMHAHEVPVVLDAFKRVLVPDGALLLRLPDLALACKAVAEGRAEQPLYQSQAGPVCAMDIIFGMRKMTALRPEMCHHTGFTEETIKKALELAGFVEVNVFHEHLDLWASGHKPKAEA